jgi:hypothetical protein
VKEMELIFIEKGYVERIDEIINKIQNVKRENLMDEFNKIDFENFGIGICGDVSSDEIRGIFK